MFSLSSFEKSGFCLFQSKVVGHLPDAGLLSHDYVAISAGDQLFLYGGSNNYYGSYANDPGTTAAIADSWVAAIAQWREFCNSHGLLFALVVVPNKATICQLT